jgi:1-phosphatidylinositol-3-phosphate 5-kinase
VKDLGGAGRGEPTIVTPRQYRQRFLSAMERYFSLVGILRWSLIICLTQKLSRFLTVG